MAKEIDFSPLLSTVTGKDIHTYNKRVSPAATISMFLFIVVCFVGGFISVTALLMAANILSSDSASVLISLLLTSLIAFGCYWHIRTNRHYEIRLQKFAAVNQFTYLQRTSRDGQDATDKKAATGTVFTNKPVAKYDELLIKGTYAGLRFKLGKHSTKYNNGEGGAYREVAFLRVRLNKSLPHILFIGGGRSIPTPTIEAAQSLDNSGTFGERFKAYAIDAKDKNLGTAEVLSSTLQDALIDLNQHVDIELHGKYITFFRKGRFQPDSLPRFFCLFALFEDGFRQKDGQF